jgi:hypothetical protein
MESIITFILVLIAIMIVIGMVVTLIVLFFNVKLFAMFWNNTDEFTDMRKDTFITKK